MRTRNAAGAFKHRNLHTPLAWRGGCQDTIGCRPSPLLAPGCSTHASRSRGFVSGVGSCCPGPGGTYIPSLHPRQTTSLPADSRSPFCCFSFWPHQFCSYKKRSVCDFLRPPQTLSWRVASGTVHRNGGRGSGFRLMRTLNWEIPFPDCVF